MSIPLKDSALAAFSTNFGTRITATPTTFGLTAAQATAYDVLHDAFIAAYAAASPVGAKSRSLVAAKNTAKANLLKLARELYGFVQASTSVSPANKELLGVVVKAPPAPAPAPADAPGLDVVSVSGRTVKLRLHDAETPSRRGRPAGVDGASVFSHVGATPPESVAGWTFEGNTTRTTIDVEFADDVAPGSKVWFTAFWFNPRAQSGPACAPISTYIQFGGAMAA